MKKKQIFKQNMYEILDEIEYRVNLEKCWLNILKKYYESSDENNDISVTLIIETIDKSNKELFYFIEEKISELFSPL